MAQQDWAIIVGIQRYPELGNLRRPENDALAFEKWARSGKGGNVPKSHVTTILSSKCKPRTRKVIDALPVDSDIKRAFDKLHEQGQENKRKGKGVRVGRRLYIFFSGHGFAPIRDESALLMANATQDRVGYHIPGKSIAEWFYHSGYFEEVILLMDCCRNEYKASPLNLPPYIDITDLNVIDRSKMFSGFAAKWSQQARERKFGNGKIHGVFTRALLEGLERACDTDGRVTAALLGSYLHENMRTFLGRLEPGVAAEPELSYDPNKGKNFLIVTIKVPKYPVNIRVPAKAVGKRIEILQNPAKPSLVSITIKPKQRMLKISLQRGLYLVKYDNRFIDFEVKGTQEERVNI